MLYLLRKDCKELFGSKKRMAVMIPVLIILIICTYYNVPSQEDNQATRIQFGVADQDGSAYSKLLLEYFKESKSFGSYIHIVEGNRNELEQAFYNGELDLFLLIPEEFVENMIYLEHLPVKVMINTSDTTKAVLLKNIMESYEKYIRAVEINCAALYDSMRMEGFSQEFIQKKNIEISYDLIFTVLGQEKFFRYREISEFPSTTLLNYYSFALISMILLYSGLYAGFQMMKEKKLGVLKRLYTVGVPIAGILSEKILFFAGILFTLLSLAYILPNLYQGNHIHIKFEIIFMAAAFFCISLSVLLSGLFHKIQNYMIAGNFLCFIFSIIGGGIIPVMYLPDTLVMLSEFTPNYWLTRVMLLTQMDKEGGLYLRIMIGLILGSILFYILGIYVYGREEVYRDE